MSKTSELKTSAEWQQILCPKVIILDPDGWDRENYDYSFNRELITEGEFNGRLCMSTVMVSDL